MNSVEGESILTASDNEDDVTKVSILDLQGHRYVKTLPLRLLRSLTLWAHNDMKIGLIGDRS
jgi:hypothetical protein